VQDIVTEYQFTAHVTLAEALIIGDMPSGVRRFVPITGGKVFGPAVSGIVLALGGDSQIAVSDTLVRVEARYYIRTDDNVTIAVINQGIRFAEASVTARLMQGSAVAAQEYYFRTTPQFEAPVSSAFAWMNTSIFIATAEREKSAATIHVHRIL
jgi:hypothetical protein